MALVFWKNSNGPSRTQVAGTAYTSVRIRPSSVRLLPAMAVWFPFPVEKLAAAYIHDCGGMIIVAREAARRRKWRGYER